ncbi:MAG: hypothetical protein HYV45_02530 [Candidatus Moranbacteria bacterium]|nr:hypothetical protein [Candidatus Moranbacteria bacterium]
MSKKIFGSVILLFWGYIFLLILLNGDYPPVCIPIGMQELTNLCEVIAQYLFIFVPIGIFFVILISWNNEVYEKWKRFTIIFLVLYLVFFIFTPTDAPDFILFYKETVAIGGVIVYAVMSLIYIAYLKFKRV